MSAVFGYFKRSPDAARAFDGLGEAALRQMAAAMPDRGHDGTRFFRSVSGSIGLGCRTRWSTPESRHETLPLTDSSGRYTLTSSARIDNRGELIAALEIARPPSGVITDADIILTAYKAWGERCPERLIGDFAFAVWDDQERQLFLACDHFAVQPIVYGGSDDGLFAFASDPRALRCLGVNARGAENEGGDVNEAELAAFLAQMPLDPEETFFEGIRRLPAAHCMTVTESRREIRRYWQLDPSRQITLASDAEYAAKLRDIFIEAVRCRMRSVGEVGCMLSGGIDSSSITCVAGQVAAERHAPPVRTFSAVVAGTNAGQEREYIDAVLNSGEYRPVYFPVDEADPAGELERMVAAVEAPNIPGNLYTNWNLYRAAADAGVAVMLEGFDGDNAVGHGVGHLRELADSGRWLALAMQLRGYTRYATREPLAPVLWSWFKRYGIGRWKERSRLAGALRKAFRRGRAQFAAQDGASGAVAPPRDWQGEPAGERVDARLLPLLSSRQASSTSPAAAFKTEREQHIATLTEFDPGRIMAMLGRIAAAHGIEVRFPFMDVRLIEFCVAIPPTQKMRNGMTRMVMRNAMQNVLPDAVRLRPGKAEYDRVFADALQRGKTRIDQFDAALARVEGFVNTKRAARLEKRLFAEELPTGEVIDVWHTLCTYYWMKQFHEAADSCPVGRDR